MIKFFKNNSAAIITFVIIFLILIINSLHYSYPDEFDNIVGGHFIDQGRLPYIGFFTHHGSIPYFYAALIGIFSGASFVKFRIILSLSYFILFVLFYSYIFKRFSKKVSQSVLVFLLFLAVMATYVWGHMLLADSLAGLLLISVYIVMFLVLLKRELISKKDLLFISITTSFALLTSLTYSYAIFFIYLFLIFWQVTKRSYPLLSKETLLRAVIMSSPYIVFLLYLVLSKSLYDFYYQAIFFNKEYYVTSDGSPINNPIRFAITILFNVFTEFRAILTQIKDLSFGSPFPHALALADILIIIYLLINKKVVLSIFVILQLIYLNARGNPYTTTETDYQAIPYQYFSLFNGIFLLSLLWEDLKEKLHDGKKIIYGFSLIFLGIYFIFLFLFLFEKAFDKAYKKYMGTQALIYDSPVVAPTLNRIISSSDYYYIGPFAFEEHLYAHGQLVSRYFITIPAMDKSEKIKSELLSDFTKNKPKVVVFNTDYLIFGTHPGLFLVEFLKQNYFTIAQLNSEGMNITTYNKDLGDYNFDRYFFFDKDKKDDILKQLVDLNLIYIDQSPKSPEKKNQVTDKR